MPTLLHRVGQFWVMEGRDMAAAVYFSFHCYLLMNSRTWNGTTHIQRGLTSLNLIQNLPHRHAKRFVSQQILDPVKVTVNINHYTKNKYCFLYGHQQATTQNTSITHMTVPLTMTWAMYNRYDFKIRNAAPRHGVVRDQSLLSFLVKGICFSREQDSNKLSDYMSCLERS